jgi:hypothetical protein
MMAPPSSSLALGGDVESPAAAAADIGGCTTNNNNKHMKRENIKSKSTKSQWKEKLRAECISRAKDARRKKIRQARRSSSNDDDKNNCCHRGDNIMGVASSTIASSTAACSNIYESRDAPSIAAMKRSREMMVQHNNNNSDTNSSSNNDQYQRMVDHTPMDYNENHHHILSSSSRQISHGGVSDAGVIDTARMLVEHELQRALTGLQHCEQIQQGAPSCKKAYHGLGGGGDNNYLGDEGITQDDEEEEEYKITEQEFAALLAEVTEELQREEELLEEELWEMERADALERERLLHQIDDYDDWEELKQQEQEQQHQQQQSWGNVYTSPLLTNMKSRVTCPICNSASLMETPFDGIQCTNATDATMNDKEQCTFALDIAHEGLTLNHLENQLRTVYEEHSAVCLKGVLSFRVNCRGGINMLMASCDDCQADVVVL